MRSDFETVDLAIPVTWYVTWMKHGLLSKGTTARLFVAFAYPINQLFLITPFTRDKSR